MGERIIPPSRRPDGTLRKEIRVRPGFVSQEEAGVYQTRGSAIAQGMREAGVPGLDPKIQKQAQGPSTKAAKKNAKRRERAAAEETANKSGAEVGDVRIAAEPAESSAPPAASEASKKEPAPEAAMAEPAQGMSAEMKRLRALQKKTRQCEQLEARRGKGEALTQQELDKLSHANSWNSEVARLEAAIAAL